MASPLILFLSIERPIPAEDAALIDAAFKPKKFREGDCLFKSGSICGELFFIIDGVLRIMVNNESGNEVTHYFLKKNQLCTILNSFNNGVVAVESIQAACDAEVMAISKKALTTLYNQLPYLKTSLGAIIQQSLINKIGIRNAYLGLDSTARYRQFMITQPDIAQKVSLTDIASYLCITPQSLSRIRRNIR